MWLLMFTALRRGPLKTRVVGMLRLATFILVVLLGVTGLCLRRAGAAMSERAWSLGDELKPLSDVLEGTTRLRLNGESLFFSMTVIPNSSVGQVLDRFEALCRQHPGPFARKMLEMSELVPPRVPGAEALRQTLSALAVTRQQDADHGAIFCMSQSGAATSDESGLEKFLATSDLAALGDLKYVMVSRGNAAEGEQNLVKVVTLWTQGRFRLDSLGAPESGDAPGSDSSIAPRPPGSTRVFSAEAVDSPYSVRVYETSAAPAEMLSFYEHALSDFEAVPPLLGLEETARAFVKHGNPILIGVERNADKTTVTLSEVGARAGNDPGPVETRAFFQQAP